MKIIKALYMLGAAALLFGAVARMFLPEYYALIYIIGAVVFAVAQFLMRPRGGSVTVRRLVMQQQLAGLLFIAAGVLMFTHTNNEWIVLLSCGAFVELYTAYRIPNEIERNK